MSTNVRDEFDQFGGSVYPDKFAHAYGYDGSGRLITDTITNGSDTYVKTYGYDGSGRLTTESLWVKQ